MDRLLVENQKEIFIQTISLNTKPILLLSNLGIGYEFLAFKKLKLFIEPNVNFSLNNDIFTDDYASKYNAFSKNFHLLSFNLSIGMIFK